MFMLFTDRNQTDVLARLIKVIFYVDGSRGVDLGGQMGDRDRLEILL